MILLNNVEIGYDKMLFEIDCLTLIKGKVYTLIGANGKGKTTFLKTLVGELAPLKGVFSIDALKSVDLTRGERSKRITFVPSKQVDVDFLRVKDFVALGRTPYTNLIGMCNSSDHLKVVSSLELLKISHLKDCFLNQISDGEKQLAAISKAIVQDTDVIILDEPTAFLDYSNRINVFELLKEIAIKLNKVILFSSHDIDSILELKTELLLLNQHSKKMEFYSANTISKTDLIKIAF